MKKLTIIIPVYNEAETISQVVKKVFVQKTPGYKKEVIIIDDASTDKTHTRLAKLKEGYNFKWIKHSKNKGKGGAIKTALKYTTGDLVLTQDADLEYDPKDYLVLLSSFNNKTPVVYGSRNLGNTNRGHIVAYLCGRALTEIHNIVHGSRLTDVHTGYKLFRTDILQKCRLEVNGFDFCNEVTAKVLKMGYKIKEVPINYYPRNWKEGKKVGVKDAFLDLFTLLKYKFVN